SELREDLRVVLAGSIVGGDARRELAGAEITYGRDELLLVRSEPQLQHATTLLRRRRRRAGRRGGRGRGLGGRCRLGRGRWARVGRGARGQGLQVAWPDVADERQVVAEPKDEGHGPGVVQLRLHEVRVDLLQLMDALHRVEVGRVVLLGGRLQRVEVLLRHHRGGDGVGEDLVLERVDLTEREAGLVQRRLERVVERHEGGDREVDDDQRHHDVDDNAEQAVDAPYRLHAVERAADRT